MYKSLSQLNVSLINIDHVSLDTEWNYDNVVSSFTRLYFVDGGKAKVHHHDRVFDLKPGYMYLIPSYTYSRYRCDDFMSQYYVSFFEELGSGLSIYNLLGFKYEIPATDHDLKNFERLLELNPNRGLSNDNPEYYDNHPILDAYRSKNEAMSYGDYLESKGILLSLFSRFVSSESLETKSDSVTAQKIMDSIQFIHENMAGNLTVEHVADSFHLNPDYYSRTFHRQIGLRPIQYIQMKRMERAQLLLASTSDTIAEIASKTGISNLSYFFRLFKRTTGVSPNKFREQHWGNVAKH